jgi:hypothetical protein
MGLVAWDGNAYGTTGSYPYYCEGMIDKDMSRAIFPLSFSWNGRADGQLWKMGR